MKFGLDVPVAGEYADPQLLGDLAADAEAAGWDGVFLQDTLSLDVPACDPWTALAVVAARTSSISLGVFMTAVTRRRPWLLARQATTIDHLSSGRLIMGAALGYAEQDFAPFGETWDPRARAVMVDEALTVMTGLWSGEPYSFHGEHYHLDRALLRPGPLQHPRIPIWLAAGWPHRSPLQRAACWDGVYLMTVHQRTNEYLSPDDVAAAVRCLSECRDPQRPAPNIGFNPPADASTTQVSAYAEAGATWWIELDNTDTGPAGYRDRIRRGPPS